MGFVNQIRNFMDLAVSALGSYKTSSFRTSKFHVWTNIIDDLRDREGIAYTHGGLYNKAHKIFKDAYKQTLKRRDTAMDETIRKSVARRSSMICTPKSGLNVQVNLTAQAEIMDDTCVLVKSGRITSLIELQGCKHKFYHSRKKRLFESDIDTALFVVELAQAIGNDAFDRLIVLVWSELSRNGLRVLPKITPSSINLLRHIVMVGMFPYSVTLTLIYLFQ